RAVVDAGGITRRHAAVLVERGLQALHRVERRAVARILIILEEHAAFARDDLHRDDLAAETAGLLRGLRLVLASHREFVLVLARAVLSDAGGEHLAHDDFRYLLGLDARALQYVLDDERAEIGGRRLRQRAAEFADRGTDRADDVDVFHAFSLVDDPVAHIAPG